MTPSDRQQLQVKLEERSERELANLVLALLEAPEGSDLRAVADRQLQGKRHGEEIAALLRML